MQTAFGNIFYKRYFGSNSICFKKIINSRSYAFYGTISHIRSIPQREKTSNSPGCILNRHRKKVYSLQLFTNFIKLNTRGCNFQWDTCFSRGGLKNKKRDICNGKFLKKNV